MPFIYLDSDELTALRDVFDARSRIGHPIDWSAYDRAKARIVDQAEALTGRPPLPGVRVRLTPTSGSFGRGSAGSAARPAAARG